MNGMKFGQSSSLSSTSETRKTHLVNLELPDKPSNVIFCHGTAQMPTIPFNLHVLMVVLRKRLKHYLSLARLHVPT